MTFVIGLLAITLFGAVLRRYHIAVAGLWYDELAEAVVATSNGASFFEGIRAQGGAAPLDYLGVRTVTFLLGHSPAATRTWSLLAGIATIPAAGMVARAISRRATAGLAAAFLTATSPFLVAYSQEARFYALTALAAVLVLWTFHLAMERSRKRDWFAFSLATAVALYTYYFLAVIVVACGIAVLSEALAARMRRAWEQERHVWWPRASGLVLSVAGATLSVTPWLLYALPIQLSKTYPYGGPGPFTLSSVRRIVETVLAPAPADQIGALWRPLMAGSVCLAAILGFLLARRFSPAVLALLLTPALLFPLVWLADARSSYFLMARHFIVIAPVLYILAGAGFVISIERVTRHRRRARVVLYVGAVLVWSALSVPPLDAHYATAASSKPAWHRAGDDVAAHICPGATAYVNLGPGLLFGIGYHHPELIEHGSELRTGPSVDAPAAIRELGLKPADWVVLWLNYYVTKQNSLPLITSELGARGYHYRDFPQIRVFSPPDQC